MRALIFDGKGLNYKTKYPVPVYRRNEALIRVTHAGICNTDIEITKGYMGFHGILGHEFVGVVERCGEKGFIGKRVTGEINIGCGRCSYCKMGIQNHCPSRSVLGISNRDGVFAEYTTIPIKNLHMIPECISDEEAVFIEPLAAAFEILQQVDIMPNHKVCVLGDGKLGLLVSQILFSTGCNLIVVGKHEKNLSIVKKMGIKTELNSSFYDPFSLSRRGVEKDFDIVIDCTGSSTGIEKALQIVKPRGKIIMKTTVAKQRMIDLNHLVVNEIAIIGSRCGPFPQAINALEEKKVAVKPLISKIFPLEEGLKAFKSASAKGILKVILRIT